MELFEYIKSQLPHLPNPAIMKNMGASEELIDYVREIVWNTNLNVIGSIMSPSDGAEVWLVGEVSDGYAQLHNNGDTNYIVKLHTNAENYQVFLNGEELPYFEGDDDLKTWQDVEGDSYSKSVAILLFEGEYMAKAEYIDASTAPTSIEVSVKAK